MTSAPINAPTMAATFGLEWVEVALVVVEPDPDGPGSAAVCKEEEGEVVLFVGLVVPLGVPVDDPVALLCGVWFRLAPSDPPDPVGLLAEPSPFVGVRVIVEVVVSDGFEPPVSDPEVFMSAVPLVTMA